MERNHRASKEAMLLGFDCNRMQSKLTSMPKDAELKAMILKERQDGARKTIDNWSSLTWICCNCQSTFDGYKVLKTHLGALHEKTKIEADHYQCNDCHMFLVSYSAFITHVRSVHYEVLKLCCDICNQIFPDYTQLSIHRDRHNETLSNDYPTVYHCTLCENAYSLEKELKNHIQLLHNAICTDEIKVEFSSNFEEKNTKTLEQSSNSKNTESIVKAVQCKEEYNETKPIYQCGKCVKSFSNEIDLKNHAKYHDINAKHICRFCSKVFQKKSRLEEHLLLHTGELPHKCEICGKCFRRKPSMLVHLRKHTGERPFKCKICRKSFHSQKFLTAHQLVHSDKRPFQCELCDKCFKSNREKKAHQVIHSDERPFQCELCEKCFKTNHEKKIHLRFHSDERPFQCEFCEKRFKSNENKKNHLRVHSDERPFQCELCEKSFKTNKEKKEHLRTHSEERPFRCELCEKSFKSNKQKKTHTKICKGHSQINTPEDSMKNLLFNPLRNIKNTK